MKIMTIKTHFAMLFAFLLSAGNEAFGSMSNAPNIIAVYPKRCQHGLRDGPDKKFAVYVFCDDAAGTSIGIINTTPGSYVGPGSEKTWKLEGRFWQDADWARDVDFIEWSKDGLKLTVFTGPVYGTNMKYVLDLVNKKIDSETKSPGYGWPK